MSPARIRLRVAAAIGAIVLGVGIYLRSRPDDLAVFILLVMLALAGAWIDHVIATQESR